MTDSWAISLTAPRLRRTWPLWPVPSRKQLLRGLRRGTCSGSCQKCKRKVQMRSDRDYPHPGQPRDNKWSCSPQGMTRHRRDLVDSPLTARSKSRCTGRMFGCHRHSSNPGQSSMPISSSYFWRAYRSGARISHRRVTAESKEFSVSCKSANSDTSLRDRGSAMHWSCNILKSVAARTAICFQHQSSTTLPQVEAMRFCSIMT